MRIQFISVLGNPLNLHARIDEEEIVWEKKIIYKITAVKSICAIEWIKLS